MKSLENTINIPMRNGRLEVPAKVCAAWATAVLGRALAQVAAAVGPDAIPHLGKGKPWKLNEQFNTIINIS